jgi:hypothetical protein
MILLMLWALLGVVLGYEAARHGIVEILVPVMYLWALFVWLLVWLVLAVRASRRGPRRLPSAQQIREAYAKMAQQDRESQAGKREMP